MRNARGDGAPLYLGLCRRGIRCWLSLPDKPSIAVSLFQNMSDHLEAEYFVDVRRVRHSSTDATSHTANGVRSFENELKNCKNKDLLAEDAI